MPITRLLDDAPLPRPDGDACALALCAFIRDQGLRVLPWDEPPCLVLVVERPAADLEAVERAIKATPGVVSLATAYLNIEDELEADPAGTC